MQHSSEMQIYKEILDKMRQLMAMEGEEEEAGMVEGKPFSVEDAKMADELGEIVEGEDKAEVAEDEAMAETEGKSGLKEEIKAFFGGGKPLLPGKKGMKVGVTEIAMLPKAKKSKY